MVQPHPSIQPPSHPPRPVHERRVDGLGVEPSAWIIERAGHLPTMTHYFSVANAALLRGEIVTPYYSKVPK